MKNTPILVCDKTEFVRWNSTESKRICSFHNFLSYNHSFRKGFKLVYRKNVVMVTLTTGIKFPVFPCIHFWIQGILKRWHPCPSTAYEVVSDCRKFEKHWVRVRRVNIKNFAILIVQIQASCLNSFRGYSWLHSEFYDTVWNTGVATPGVGLSESCRMLCSGPYLPCSGTSSASERQV
jgi:hypothetical protein